jgi:hypothetical protein
LHSEIRNKLWLAVKLLDILSARCFCTLHRQKRKKEGILLVTFLNDAFEN